MKKVTIRQSMTLDYAGEEALNTICTNLAFSGRNLRKIVFTSNLQSEGKSWMAMHVLANLAQRGRKVVLVDADMRRSFLMQRYKMEADGEVFGLAHYLTGQCELEDATYETNLDGACLIPAGRDVTNPVSLVDTPFFKQMLDTLSEKFDMVIVDTPPIGMVIDAAEIAVFEEYTSFCLNCGYSDYQRYRAELPKFGAKIDDTQFSDRVKMLFCVKDTVLESLSVRVRELSNGGDCIKVVGHRFDYR